MKKRVLAAVLAMMMTVTALAGCGSNSGSSEGASSAGGSTEADAGASNDGESESDEEAAEGTLTLAIWDTFQEPGLTEICDEFTEKTGIKVKVQVTPWDQYWTLLEAGATGGSLPDVFWMHSNEISKYARSGMLMDLSDKIAGSDVVDLEQYPEDIVGIYNWEDAQFAIPKDVDTIALWYNKTYFDEAGLDYPDDTWTWDDMKEAARELTTDDYYGYGARVSTNQDGWYNVVYANGGYIINDDKTESGYSDPKTIEAIEYYYSFVEEGISPDHTVTSENEITALFESGTVAMALFGSWMIAELTNNEYVQENCDIAIIPKGSEGRASIYNGLGYAAPANAENPDAVWALLEYLGSEEAQLKQAELGVTMSAYEGTSEAWVNCAPEFNLHAYLDVMEDIYIRPYSIATVTWENMVTEKLVNAWTGNASVADVCQEIAEEMNRSLQEEKN